MKKLEHITKQELKEKGISFEQACERLQDVQCDLVAAKQLANYEAYRRSFEYFNKSDAGPDTNWTLIEGPQGSSGAFLICNLDKQTTLERIQNNQHGHAHEERRQTERA